MTSTQRLVALWMIASLTLVQCGLVSRHRPESPEGVGLGASKRQAQWHRRANNTLFNTTLVAVNGPAGQAKASIMPGNLTLNTTNAIINATSLTLNAGQSFNKPMKSLGQVSDSSCDNAQETPGSAAWNVSGGDLALAQFTDMWTNNLLYCDDCFGMVASACKSNATGCKQGLRDAAQQIESGPKPRLDVAMSLYANFTNAVTCGANGNGCSQVTCSDVKGSAAAYVLVKGMVSMSNYLQHAFSTLENAIPYAQGFEQKVQQSWFPTKDMSGDRSAMSILLALFNGLVGLIPEVGKYTKDFGSSLLVAFGNSEFANNLPTPTNLAYTVSDIGYRVTNSTAAFSDSFFSDGTYGPSGKSVNFLDAMKNGALLDILNPTNDLNDQMFDNYVKIMYQNLLYLHFQNIPGQQPFISFAPGKCSDLDYSLKSTQIPFPGLNTLDSNVDWNGSCYWLMYMSNPSQYEASLSNWICPGTVVPIDGGTNKVFSDANIAGLSLADFIVPSVKGWLANGKLNGFPIAGAQSQLVPDPQAPAAVNFTVCDYMGNRDLAGMGCPALNREQNNGDNCNLQDYSTMPLKALVVPNDATYTPGQCKIHLDQYQKETQNGGDNTVNPDISQYQLRAVVYDGQNRVIGNAAKAWVGAIWQLYNTALPFDIFIHVPDDEHAALELWYSSQHWTTFDLSNQFHCSVGPWINGQKHIECTFACPAFKDGDTIAPSATISHPLPTGAIIQPVIPFGTPALHTYTKTKPSPTSDPQKTPSNYEPGLCTVHVTQYRPGVDGILDQWQMETYLYKHGGGAQFSEFANAMVPAPSNQPMNIYGLRSYFSVDFGSGLGDYMQFNYINTKGAQTLWNSDDWWGLPDHHECNVTDWGNEARDAYCTFACD